MLAEALLLDAVFVGCAGKEYSTLTAAILFMVSAGTLSLAFPGFLKSPGLGLSNTKQGDSSESVLAEDRVTGSFAGEGVSLKLELLLLLCAPAFLRAAC